jgi:hypothetical protein
MFQKVTVVVGKPIQLDLVLEDLRSRGASAEEQRKVITDLVQVIDLASFAGSCDVKAAYCIHDCCCLLPSCHKKSNEYQKIHYLFGIIRLIHWGLVTLL